MEPLGEYYRALIVDSMLRAGHLHGLEILRRASSEYRISVGAVISPRLTWLRVGFDSHYEWHARSDQWVLRSELARSNQWSLTKDLPKNQGWRVGATYNELVDIPLADDPDQTLQVVMCTTERTGAEMEQMTGAFYFHATFGLAGGYMREPRDAGEIEFDFVALPVDHVVDSRFDAFTGPLGAEGALVEARCLSCPNENHPWIRYLAFVTATPDIPPYALIRMIRQNADQPDRPWAQMKAERMLVEKNLHLMREIVADVSGAQPRLVLRWMPGAAKMLEQNDASFERPMPSYPVA
jgi:hypothetical protein